MPFDQSNPPAKLKNLSEKKQRQWISVFNSCWENHHDDEKCHKMAWGVVKKANENINELGLPREKMVDQYKLQESDGAASQAVIPRINTTDRIFGADKQVYEVALLQRDGPEKVLGYVTAASRAQAWTMVRKNPKYAMYGEDRLNVAIAKPKGAVMKEAKALLKIAKSLISSQPYYN